MKPKKKNRQKSITINIILFTLWIMLLAASLILKPIQTWAFEGISLFSISLLIISYRLLNSVSKP